jgi:hypothetical protein
MRWQGTFPCSRIVVKKSQLHSCNLLELTADSKRLWHFVPTNNQTGAGVVQTLGAKEPLPAGQVGKDWRTLFKRKVNIAWLPTDQVFLKVLHLPVAEFDELLSMVEFQLEKISPLPVAQAVWTIALMPRRSEELQPVMVVIAESSMVETFVGRLESAGYLPDRLELGCLEPLLGTRPEEDGVWMYAFAEEDANVCLVAWQFAGRVEQVQLLRFAASGNCGKLLVEELTKTAWAAEFEGWFHAGQPWHLVADPTLTEAFAPELRQWVGESLRLEEPVSLQLAAEHSARRAAYGGKDSNLLPPRFTARYHQEFVGRLWMAGLAAVFGAYLVGVMIYFGAVQVLAFQKRTVEKQVAGLSQSYTNAVWLKARVEVLQDQLALKYAALDLLKAVSDLLPPELSLQQFAFTRGERLRLVGSAPQDQSSRLIDYASDLRRVMIRGEALFSSVEPGPEQTRGQSLSWSFNCELNRTKLE